jgi:hypothetical protein
MLSGKTIHVNLRIIRLRTMWAKLRLVYMFQAGDTYSSVSTSVFVKGNENVRL